MLTSIFGSLCVGYAVIFTYCTISVCIMRSSKGQGSQTTGQVGVTRSRLPHNVHLQHIQELKRLKPIEWAPLTWIAVSSLTVLGLGVCRVAAPLCHRQLCTKTIETPPTATPASGGGIFSRFWVWLNDDSGGELVSVCLCAYTCTSVCSCTCSV